MKIIQQANEFITGLIKPNVSVENIKPSQFNILKIVSGRYILLNTLTREIVLLDEHEYRLYDSVNIHYDKSNVFINTLIAKSFFVPADMDELKRYKDILKIDRLICKSENSKIVQYKIFTTTYCNARCFYCFEEGMTYNHMTIETAEKVVQYILKTCTREMITLYWFGGEPLCNVQIIDYICKRLREEKKEYQSKIITNGYLFNEQLVDKAVNLWNLIFAQITLDGTEEEHNRRKAYIKASESPFKRTVNNIRRLLGADVFVSVRLNFDENNFDDINRLIDIISVQFKEYKKFRAYPAILSNDWLNHQEERTAETEDFLNNEFLSVYKHLIECGLYKSSKIRGKIKPYFCMAANPACATISAKGELYTCQSCDDNMKFGTVADGVKNQAMLNEWEDCISTLEKCEQCPYLPECCAFNKCPTQKSYCKIEKDFVLMEQFKRLSVSSDDCNEFLAEENE